MKTAQKKIKITIINKIDFFCKKNLHLNYAWHLIIFLATSPSLSDPKWHPAGGPFAKLIAYLHIWSPAIWFSASLLFIIIHVCAFVYYNNWKATKFRYSDTGKPMGGELTYTNLFFGLMLPNVFINFAAGLYWMYLCPDWKYRHCSGDAFCDFLYYSPFMYFPFILGMILFLIFLHREVDWDEEHDEWRNGF